MRVSVLGSGSDGNAIYVEHDGSALLVDAGLSPAVIDRRLVKIGVVGHSHIRALFVTHDHGDHARYVGEIEKKWHVRLLCGSYGLDSTTVVRFAVPHDAKDACGYVVWSYSTRKSVGICLDCGMVTPEITDNLRGCDVVILGCDYDDDLLDANESYPAELKNRIRSNTGHLSTRQVADFLRNDWDGKAHTIVLAHLSKSNNCSAWALKAAMAAVEQRGYAFNSDTKDSLRLLTGDGKPLRFIVSSQDSPTELIQV